MMTHTLPRHRLHGDPLIPLANVHVQVWDVRTPALLRAARRGRGRLLAQERGHNMVVNGGRDLICAFLAGESVTGITRFALGDTAAAVVSTDTALGGELTRQPVSQLVTSPLTVTAKYFLSSTQLNGYTIREAGLFNDAGVMIARYVLDTPIAKTGAIAVAFIWSLTFTGEASVMNVERGAVVELGGDPNTYLEGNSYPSGATLDKIVNGSSTWLIDSATLPAGTYCLEAHLKITSNDATAIPTVALFDLSGAAPDTPLTGSAVSATATQTGSPVRSGTITFPAGGAAKRLAVKAKTDKSGGQVVAWGLRIIKTA